MLLMLFTCTLFSTLGSVQVISLAVIYKTEPTTILEVQSSPASPCISFRDAHLTTKLDARIRFSESNSFLHKVMRCRSYVNIGTTFKDEQICLAVLLLQNLIDHDLRDEKRLPTPTRIHPGLP